MTLLPGLIDAHTHIFLHPYNETPWTQQVLAEPLAVRTARAVTHVRNTLMAGFTTIRDLGTEGAGNSDVGIKQAIEQGIIPGPRMLVVTRAIVATGAYGPPRDLFSFEPPQGAQEADGPEIQHAVRQQIGNGADWVKMYADYGWGPGNQQRPTFSEEELALAVETARSSGRAVSTHATTAEGMRRAIAAGVETIEHGDDGTPEIFRSMVAHHIALCPTVEASYAIATYRGWHPGTDPEPPSHREEARQPARRAQCRRHDLQRQRRRRLPARRKRTRDRVAGRLGHAGDRRAAIRHVDRCHGAAHGRPDRPRRTRSQGGPRRRHTATRRTTSAP